MKHSPKFDISSGMMRRSITWMPRFFASAMTVRRVMPSKKQSGVGVWIFPSVTKKILAPVHSAIRPCQSSISASA
jgi:hypothetical protein